jgi:phospholipase C
MDQLLEHSRLLPDSLFYNWTVSSKKIATNIKPLSQFYSDPKAGTLPQFTYLNP